ncbi:MAG TPA: DUF2975 domain-containing protein [Rhizomicrobium sp.]|jgi:voltage-gated potassium channel Kch
MTISPQLVRASRIMAWLSVIGAVLAPLVTALCFIWPVSTQPLDVHFNHIDIATVAAAPLGDRLLALIFALIPALIVTWGLLSLARLFRAFTQGEIFSLPALRALSSVTAALFWNVVATFVMQAPLTYLISMHNPPGHRFMSIGFGSDDVDMLFLAGVTFVIARVMAEARRVAEENAGFV